MDVNPLDPLYIPPRLLHRDREVRILRGFISDSQDEPVICTIYGVRGIGKTVLARWVLNHMKTPWTYSHIERLFSPFPHGQVSIIDDVRINDPRVIELIDRVRENGASLILVFEMLNFLRIREYLMPHVDAVLELDIYTPKQFWDIVADRINQVFGELPRVIYDFIADMTLTFDSPRPGTAIQVIRQVYFSRRRITPRSLMQAANELGFIDGYSTDLITGIGLFSRETLLIMEEMAVTILSDDIPYFTIEQIDEIYHNVHESVGVPYSKERLKLLIRGLINAGIIFRSNFRPNMYFSILDPELLRMAIEEALMYR